MWMLASYSQHLSAGVLGQPKASLSFSVSLSVQSLSMFFPTPPHISTCLSLHSSPLAPSLSHITPILRLPSIKPLLSLHLGVKNAFSLPSAPTATLNTSSSQRKGRAEAGVNLRWVWMTNLERPNRRFGSNNEIQPGREAIRLTLPSRTCCWPLNHKSNQSKKTKKRMKCQRGRKRYKAYLDTEQVGKKYILQ